MNGERLVIEEPGFLPVGITSFFGGKDQVRVARHARNRCVETSFQFAVCVDVAMAIIREFLGFPGWLILRRDTWSRVNSPNVFRQLDGD